MQSCCEAQEQFGIQNGDVEGVENDEMEDPAATGVTTDMDCEKYKKCCCEDGSENNGGGIPFNPDDPPPPPDPPVEYDNNTWIFLPIPLNDDSSDDDEDPEDTDDLFDPTEVPFDDPSHVEEPEGGDTLSDLDDGDPVDGTDPPIPPIIGDDDDDPENDPIPDGDQDIPGGGDGDQPIEEPIEIDDDPEPPCKKFKPNGSCECLVGDPTCNEDHPDYEPPLPEEDPVFPQNPPEEDPEEPEPDWECEQDALGSSAFNGGGGRSACDDVWNNVNRLRVSRGLRTLRWDAQLAEAAQQHAQYLYEKGVLTHGDDTYPELQNPQPGQLQPHIHRANDAGYDQTWIVENISRIPEGDGFDVVMGGDNATGGWWQDHRFEFDHGPNMIEPSLTRAGVGCYCDYIVWMGARAPNGENDDVSGDPSAEPFEDLDIARTPDEIQDSNTPQLPPGQEIVNQLPVPPEKALLPTDGSAGSSDFEFMDNRQNNVNHVILVVDRSGSMGNGYPASRWVKVQMEALQAVAAMEGNARIRVIAFNTGFVSYPAVGYANPNEWSAIRLFMSGLITEGDTDPLPALEDAFATEPRADVIYFLTDGDFHTQPSQVAEANRNPPIPIRTTSLISTAGASKLRQISNQSQVSYGYNHVDNTRI